MLGPAPACRQSNASVAEVTGNGPGMPHRGVAGAAKVPVTSVSIPDRVSAVA